MEDKDSSAFLNNREKKVEGEQEQDEEEKEKMLDRGHDEDDEEKEELDVDAFSPSLLPALAEEKDPEMCSICFDRLFSADDQHANNNNNNNNLSDDGDARTVVMLPACAHHFHRGCVLDWMKKETAMRKKAAAAATASTTTTHPTSAAVSGGESTTIGTIGPPQLTPVSLHKQGTCPICRARFRQKELVTVSNPFSFPPPPVIPRPDLASVERFRLLCGHKMSLRVQETENEKKLLCSVCSKPAIRLDVVPALYVKTKEMDIIERDVKRKMEEFHRARSETMGKKKKGGVKQQAHPFVVYYNVTSRIAPDYRALQPFGDVIAYKIVSVVISNESPRLRSRSSSSSSSSFNAASEKKKGSSGNGFFKFIKRSLFGGYGSSSSNNNNNDDEMQDKKKKKDQEKEEEKDEEKEDQVLAVLPDAKGRHRALRLHAGPSSQDPRTYGLESETLQKERRQKKYCVLNKMSAILTMQLPGDRSSIYYTDQTGKSGLVPPTELRGNEKYCTNLARVIGFQLIGDPEQCKQALLAYASGHAFFAAYNTGRGSTVRHFPQEEDKMFLYETGQESVEPNAGQGCGNGSCGSGIYFFLDSKSALRYWAQRNFGYSHAENVPLITRKITEHEYRKRQAERYPEQGALVVCSDPEEHDELDLESETSYRTDVEKRKRRALLENWIYKELGVPKKTVAVDPLVPCFNTSDAFNPLSARAIALRAKARDSQKHEQDWVDRQCRHMQKMHLFLNERFRDVLIDVSASSSSSSFTGSEAVQSKMEEQRNQQSVANPAHSITEEKHHQYNIKNSKQEQEKESVTEVQRGETLQSGQILKHRRGYAYSRLGGDNKND